MHTMTCLHLVYTIAYSDLKVEMVKMIIWQIFNDNHCLWYGFPLRDRQTAAQYAKTFICLLYSLYCCNLLLSDLKIQIKMLSDIRIEYFYLWFGIFAGNAFFFLGLCVILFIYSSSSGVSFAAFEIKVYFKRKISGRFQSSTDVFIQCHLVDTVISALECSLMSLFRGHSSHLLSQWALISALSVFFLLVPPLQSDKNLSW